MKLGSLFDGSGTAPLAAAMCGVEPVWASEIEPYPIRVTTKRFPRMRHLGDITKINGAEIEPVDIICGGSPCQDLSVAGKQAGLKNGKRSHLFFEMTRIIKEMRDATNGEYPRYVIWENVPGAFSSNNGYDFLAVLQGFAEIAETDIHVPEPERKTDKLVWRYAGEMVGNGWSIAWRTLDAQYWGVPQRRRRIFLVAAYGGISAFDHRNNAEGYHHSERAGEILFECEGLPRNSEPRRETWEGSAAPVVGGTERGDCHNVQCLNPWDSQTIRQYSINGVFPALISNENGGQNRNGVVYPAIIYDARGNGRGDIAPTITGDHENRITDYSALAVYKQDAQYGSYSTGLPLLRKSGGDIGGGSEAIIYEYPVRTGPLMANSHPGSYTGQDAFSDMLPVINNPASNPTRKYIVRRLTPLECCRLQGFPDCWESDLETADPAEEEIAFWMQVFETYRQTMNPTGKPKTRKQIVKWLKNPYSDSASYQMWGNGMTLPCMLFIMKRVAIHVGNHCILQRKENCQGH